MYNIADESVQFSPTQLFIQSRRGCSASNGQGVQLGRYIHARYTPQYADLYKQRKETIERVFADAKEKHAMRYTPYRGLAQVSNWVRLKFAAMNLKKFAKRKWRDNHPSDFFAFFSFFTRLYTKTPISALA